jgi:hypothetical protein
VAPAEDSGPGPGDVVQQQAAGVSIRFKDGKPLMVDGGLIAGSQTCCCGGGTCSIPLLAAYSVEFEEYSSWEARCGSPAGFPFFLGVSGPDGWYSNNVLTAENAELGATRVKYFRLEWNQIAESYELGASVLILGNAFSFQSGQPNTNSPLGAFIYVAAFDQYGNVTNRREIYLDVNFSVSAVTGLSSWTFRLANNVIGEKAWTAIHPFYSQTSEDKKCVSSSTLSPCNDISYFHLPSDVLFSCASSGVSVTVGGQTTSYGWAQNFPALTFSGTFDIWIRRKFSCFQDCDFETNLCCPLP